MEPDIPDPQRWCPTASTDWNMIFPEPAILHTALHLPSRAPLSSKKVYVCTLTSLFSECVPMSSEVYPQLSSRVNIPNRGSSLVLIRVELSRQQETLLRIQVTLAQLTSPKVLFTGPCCCCFTTYCSFCSETWLSFSLHL